ncbi:MAG: HypC/HybG/HupF family hydrogenase formation chaperone [Candidatus Dormibacteria bacterium]
MTEPSCDQEICITCSDQLLEMVVTAVDDEQRIATAEGSGTRCSVSIELLDSVRVGEHLLVHGGVALQRGTVEVSP